MLKWIKIFKRLGRQPLKIIKNEDAVVIINNRKYPITDIKYENGKIIGLETTS